MPNSDIAHRASFEDIRYAQLWEDADVLLAALPQHGGATLASICSAGDNAISMLALNPARVVVFDLSLAQLHCLRLRIAAMRTLEHAEFLILMGARASKSRGDVFDHVVSGLPADELAFWRPKRDAVIAHGAGGIGKFERYFRIFRRWLLPLAHSRTTIEDVFLPRPDKAERDLFFNTRWNNLRWRLLLSVFFSRTLMGRLGRDPAFFDHVEGSVAAHVSRRLTHAAVDLDPSENPYLHWILQGTHGDALPHAWRAANYEMLRDRLDRLDIKHGAIESFLTPQARADGFNLSDIFEYMHQDAFEKAYGAILAAANPNAHLVYWNMMAPRRVPERFSNRVKRRASLEAAGKAADKAFFYSDFVVEQVNDS